MFRVWIRFYPVIYNPLISLNLSSKLQHGTYLCLSSYAASLPSHYFIAYHMGLGLQQGMLETLVCML